MFGLGTTELIIILVIMVMLFGVGKLPVVARQLGSGIKEFKKELEDEGATASLEQSGAPTASASPER